MIQLNSDAVAANTLALLPDLLKVADETAERLGYPDAGLRHEYQRHFLMLLSQACVQVFGTRPEHPDWVPHTSVLFPWGAPNPDTMYSFAAIDPKGTYRISGTQGDESVASVMLRKGGPNNGNIHGATLDEIDVNALAVDDQGQFSFLLSSEKPTAYSGDWFPLHADTTGIISRRVTSTIEQRDGVWCIERLDRKPANCLLSPEQVAERITNLSGFVCKFNEFILNYVLKLRREALNTFVGERFPDLGGMRAQMYFQGTWEIDADEALIIESELPREVGYSNIQLLDPFYGAIDSTFHESSINDTQAHIDSDGRVRFVICADDPGVPNWLSTGGWRSGAMMHRWHNATDFPHPTVRKVKRSEIRDVLPSDTPFVSEDERAQKLSERIRQYQSRRRW